MTILRRSSTPHIARMQRIVVLGATSSIALEFQCQLACKDANCSSSPAHHSAFGGIAIGPDGTTRPKR
jgi:hypothetical protein